MRTLRTSAALLALAATAALHAQNTAPSEVPRIESKGGRHAFIVDGAPFGMDDIGYNNYPLDVAGRCFDLRAHISGGVNALMSGIPNWTHDLGGVALQDRFASKTPAAADLAE